MSDAVVERDRGWDAFKKKFLAASDGLVVAVGVQGENAQQSHGDDGMTNAELGVIHEYGSEDNTNPPARPHWAPTLIENEAKYLKQIADIHLEITKAGGSVKGHLLLVGEAYKADVIMKIRSSIPPKLADETIERKRGETVPLITTGQYINSFSAVVKKRSEVSE